MAAGWVYPCPSKCYHKQQIFNIRTTSCLSRNIRAETDMIGQYKYLISTVIIVFMSVLYDFNRTKNFTTNNGALIIFIES